MTAKTNQATAPAQDIEWGAIEGENTEFAVLYPRMQWQHGEAKASGFLKTGGLFISKEQYPNFSGEGFEPTVLVTDDGTEIEGYAANEASLAIVRIKHQWVKDEKYSRNVPLAHALAFVKGCEDPINISLRGATKALEFQNAFNQHMLQNVSFANRTRPSGSKPLEPFALWFRLRAGASRKVQAKDSDKSSSVTPPELFAPEKIDRDHVVSLWVGVENYTKFASFFKETDAWQKSPIWEQRGTDNHEPEFTGDEMATEAQLQHFVNICTAKDLNEKDIVGQATKGVTDDFMRLSRNDARQLIDGLKAL